MSFYPKSEPVLITTMLLLVKFKEGLSTLAEPSKIKNTVSGLSPC